MAVVRQVSHRVAVMYLEIVEIGPPAALFGNPQPYTKLIAAVPVGSSRRGIRRNLDVES